MPLPTAIAVAQSSLGTLLGRPGYGSECWPQAQIRSAEFGVPLARLPSSSSATNTSRTASCWLVALAASVLTTMSSVSVMAAGRLPNVSARRSRSFHAKPIHDSPCACTPLPLGY